MRLPTGKVSLKTHAMLLFVKRNGGFMEPTIQSLHEKNVSLFQKYREIEGCLLDTLQEFDKRRGYLNYGESSLFNYCVHLLKMTESQTFTFIRVSRKAVEVPLLKEAVQAKRISISSAKVIASVITPKNQDSWIEKAENLSKNALEREVTQVNPKAMKADRIIAVTRQLSELRGIVSDEALDILKRVKELESKNGKAACDLNGAILAMGGEYLSKKDPVRRAERSLNRRNTRSAVPRTRKANLSRHIPAEIKHEVNRRDRGSCRALDSKAMPCGSRHYPQFHHIKPLCEGGNHTTANIITFCSGHHKALHR
jgi:5-methylcytosine-specific restriction endonuclease McrA